MKKFITLYTYTLLTPGSGVLVSERKVTVSCESSYWPPNIADCHEIGTAGLARIIHTAILTHWHGGLCSGTEVCTNPALCSGYGRIHMIPLKCYIEHLVLSRGCALLKLVANSDN